MCAAGAWERLSALSVSDSNASTAPPSVCAETEPLSTGADECEAGSDEVDDEAAMRGAAVDALAERAACEGTWKGGWEAARGGDRRPARRRSWSRCERAVVGNSSSGWCKGTKSRKEERKSKRRNRANKTS